MSHTEARSVIIIGSGPAGHTAAIYAARANLKPLMFEGLARGGIPGGQLMITNDVENYPGFPEKITGPDLMKAFREQSVAQGVEIVTDDVNKVDSEPAPVSRSWSGDDTIEHHEARTVIIATGAQAKWLGLESEAALQGRASAPAPCATARSSATRTSSSSAAATRPWKRRRTSPGLCRTVTLVHRREEFRASKTMQDRVLQEPEDQVPSTTRSSKRSSTSRKGEVTGARVREHRRRTRR